MRLTLRTMLACLDADNRLDPADVEDLTQKIQESKYARELAAQIRQLAQNPRVGTPRLDAKGSGLDLNSVSEYLDNTLASERISEFERNCIDSNVRLAEVSACHQILVLVLEHPAEFDPAVRDRMYRLGADAARRTADAPESETVATAAGTARIDRPANMASTPVEPKPAPEVPDYLRAGRKPSLWPLALAAALAFVLVGLVLRVMGPLDNTHPMARLLRGGDPQQVEPIVQPKSIVEPEVVAPIEDKKKLPDDGDIKLPEDPTTKTPSTVDPPEPEDKKTKTDPPEPDTKPIPPVEPIEKPVVPVEEPVKPVKPVDPLQPAVDVGRFMSEDQTLVRREADGEFKLVGAAGAIFAGDELLVLPLYRPQLLMASEVQLTVAGESQLNLAMNHAGGTSRVAIPFGRVLATGKTGAKLALDLGIVQGVVTFAAADSEIGIEVRSYLPPGTNPQSPGSTIPVVRLYATRRAIRWQEGTLDAPGEATTIESAHVRNYVGQQPGETVALVSLPDWVDVNKVTDIDRRTAREVALRFKEKELVLALKEAADAKVRQQDHRALAIRALAFLGLYEPSISAFNDENQRLYWAVELDSLRDAMNRNPAIATQIHDVYIKTRGQDDGENLYRMLWSFSPADLDTDKSTLAEELVKSLDYDELDYRVLSFENLRRITGLTQLYQPKFPAAQRKTPIAQWRERLENGEIAYKLPPAPIQDPKPAAAVPAPVRPDLPER